MLLFRCTPLQSRPLTNLAPVLVLLSCLDLSKAFDEVSHPVPLDKMLNYKLPIYSVAEEVPVGLRYTDKTKR